METNGRLNKEVTINPKYIPRILSYGLMFCALLIIFSVDYLFIEKKYMELAVTSILFIIIVLAISRLNK